MKQYTISEINNMSMQEYSEWTRNMRVMTKHRTVDLPKSDNPITNISPAQAIEIYNKRLKDTWEELWNEEQDKKIRVLHLEKTKSVITRSDRPDKPIVYEHSVDQDSYGFYREQYVLTGDINYLEKMVERVEPDEK